MKDVEYDEDSKACYLVLKHTGPKENFSCYQRPVQQLKSQSDSTLCTWFKKLRFDPQTMLVDTSDFKYSTSTGHVTHPGIPYNDKIAYGTAMDCIENALRGYVQLSLKGTNFAFQSDFKVQGQGASSTKKTEDDQIVQMWVGNAWCGFGCSVDGFPDKCFSGGKIIKLKIIEPKTAQEKDACTGSNLSWNEEEEGCYLNLPASSTDGENKSCYQKPTTSAQYFGPSSTLCTVFTKVRFNPLTLLVNTWDLRYAQSSGEVQHKGQIWNSIPWGSLEDCESYGWNSGHATVNLVGTDYAFVQDQFIWRGVHGAVTVSQNDQRVSLEVGGAWCGFGGPKQVLDPGNNTSIGGWWVKLKKIN